MTFDNSKKIYSLRIRMFVVIVLLFTYLALSYIAKLITFPLLGMSDSAWTLILVAIFIYFAFSPMLYNYQYVWFSDEGETIVFRYFTAGIVGGKKNSVKIEKNLFAGYKTESKLFGLSKSIILFQKLGQSVAKYPPVYISALSREQRYRLLSSLDLYTPKA
ncbi:MAG: hypothetical protein QG611_722 [Bacteroidota bacterium]|nr:hypothetical protein [Bacteroidota bacterium]